MGIPLKTTSAAKADASNDLVYNPGGTEEDHKKFTEILSSPSHFSPWDMFGKLMGDADPFAPPEPEKFETVKQWEDPETDVPRTYYETERHYRTGRDRLGNAIVKAVEWWNETTPTAYFCPKCGQQHVYEDQEGPHYEEVSMRAMRCINCFFQWEMDYDDYEDQPMPFTTKTVIPKKNIDQPSDAPAEAAS